MARLDTSPNPVRGLAQLSWQCSSVRAASTVGTAQSGFVRGQASPQDVFHYRLQIPEERGFTWYSTPAACARLRSAAAFEVDSITTGTLLGSAGPLMKARTWQWLLA